VLKRLLPKSAKGFIDSPKAREKLVQLADSLLIAEAPQARLIPAFLRRRLIAQVLDDILPSSGLETAVAEFEWGQAGGLEAELQALPSEDVLQELGVRGFTLKAASGVSGEEIQSIVNHEVAGALAIKPFPSLLNTYTVELVGDSKPLVSEAYAVSERLMASSKFVYAEPNLAIPAQAQDRPLPTPPHMTHAPLPKAGPWKQIPIRPKPKPKPK